MSTEFEIRSIDADEASARIEGLVEVIRDSVVNGASVNFLADVTDDELRDYWLESIAEQRLGSRLLYVALADDRVVGTAMLLLAPQANQQHRADVSKMLVHSSCRRRGLGNQLLAAIEDAAVERERTLLMLDTEQGSAGEHLYVANGWTAYGVVPGHALQTDGTPKATTFFYKLVGPRVTP